MSDFAERVKPPRLAIAAMVHVPACCLGPSLFAARCSSTWQPRGGRPTIILPRGCVGARFIVPARAPLRESPDPLFPGGHCGAHLEGKPSSAPVIVNHCDGCHMWAAATQDCAAYQRGFGHFLPEFTIASARILCQCRRSSDFSAVGQYLRVEGCGNPRVP